MKFHRVLCLIIIVSSMLLANGMSDLKHELAVYMPCMRGLSAPSATLFDSGTRSEEPAATGASEIIRRFGLMGGKIRSLLDPMDADIVLGYFNPDTVLVIDSDTTIYANIYLVNNAQVIVRDCVFSYKGDIFATGVGSFWRVSKAGWLSPRQNPSGPAPGGAVCRVVFCLNR